MNFEAEDFEFQAEDEAGGVFSEGELNELAAELLSTQSEEEFDQFLGGLLKKAASAIGSAIKSPIGQQVGGMLKGLAKQHLPGVASTLGGPAIAPFASALGSQAGSWLGGELELEALGGEEMEYEMAKQFVRVAGDAAKNAVTAPPGHPVEVARRATRQAVQSNAPGLLQGGNGVSAAGVAGRTSGRWVRRGAKIIVLGA